MALVMAMLRSLSASECSEEIAAKLVPAELDAHLLDPMRVAALMVNASKRVKNADGVSSAFGAHIEELVSLPCEPQVNAFVERHTGMKDVFRPFSLVSESANIDDVALVAVAAEKIKVKWSAPMKRHEDVVFTAADGTRTQHPFASSGPAFEKMDVVQIGTTLAVLVKTDVEDRYMLVGVPEDGQKPSDLLALLSSGEYRVSLNYYKARVSFPFIDAKMPDGGMSIMDKVKKGMGIERIFDASTNPFDGMIVDKDGDSSPCFVSDVQHYASFEADNIGATAKAVTAAPVAVFRSLGPPNVDVCADRPFLAAIVKLVENRSLIAEFVVSVETAAALARK